MAEINTKEKATCTLEDHTEHLCYMISQGFNITDVEEFRVLTENARFRCNHCHRAAKNPANLCIPEHL